MRSRVALGQLVTDRGNRHVLVVLFRRKGSPGFDRAQRQRLAQLRQPEQRQVLGRNIDPICHGDALGHLARVREPEGGRPRSRCRRRVLCLQLERVRISEWLHRGTVAYRPARSPLVGCTPAHQPQATGIDVHVSSRLDDDPHRLRRQCVRSRKSRRAHSSGNGPNGRPLLQHELSVIKEASAIRGSLKRLCPAPGASRPPGAAAPW